MQNAGLVRICVSSVDVFGSVVKKKQTHVRDFLCFSLVLLSACFDFSLSLPGLRLSWNLLYPYQFDIIFKEKNNIGDEGGGGGSYEYFMLKIMLYNIILVN